MTTADDEACPAVLPSLLDDSSGTDEEGFLQRFDTDEAAAERVADVRDSIRLPGLQNSACNVFMHHMLRPA